MSVALLGLGKKAMREAARQAVPPSVVKSLKAILLYLETAEECDYHATPAMNRSGHVYRHLRRVKAWLTPWAWNGWDSPALLPSLGHIVLNLPDPQFWGTKAFRQTVTGDFLERILDTHLMHHWGEGPDAAAGEANHDERESICKCDGQFQTHHDVCIGGDTVRLNVETTLSASTTITAVESLWEEPSGKYDYFYDSVDGPPKNSPLVPGDEKSVQNITHPPMPTGSQSGVKLPVIFHPSLEADFDYWCNCCNFAPSHLCQESELAIRTRHKDAHRVDRINAGEAEVFILPLGGERNVRMYYSTEPHAYVVRGYFWDRKGEDPSDFIDLGAGGFYRGSFLRPVSVEEGGEDS